MVSVLVKLKIFHLEPKCIYFKKDGKPITGHHIQDRYTMSFLSSLNYTENCYYCRYATDKRVGDITIGDAWGSDLKEEIDNGISLIMCQTEKAKSY